MTGEFGDRIGLSLVLGQIRVNILNNVGSDGGNKDRWKGHMLGGGFGVRIDTN
jgi:hypothetical protein